MTGPEATLLAGLGSALIGALVALIGVRILHRRELGEFVRTARKQSLVDAWDSLLEVQAAADALWEEASPENLSPFISTLRSAHRFIQKASIVLEEDAVDKLRAALKEIGSYGQGKENLMDIRGASGLSRAEKLSIGRSVVEENRRALDRYRSLLREIEDDFRERIKRET